MSGSLAMMSTHTPTHSSQIMTAGPAMSFLTSFWVLLQKEHRRDSVMFSPNCLTLDDFVASLLGAILLLYAQWLRAIQCIGA
jgi:hypothetical protein